MDPPVDRGAQQSGPVRRSRRAAERHAAGSTMTTHSWPSAWMRTGYAAGSSGRRARPRGYPSCGHFRTSQL